MKNLSEHEYKERAKLIEKIEGYCGTDNGFSELKTETLAQLVAMIAYIRAQNNK
jgi:hypothetical protein